MQNAFFWIIALVMVGLGIYTNYINWTTYMKSKKEKAAFMKNHKDSVMDRVTPNRFWWFVLLAVVCFGLMVMLLMQDASTFQGAGQVSQAALYFGLGVFALALIPENIMDSQVVSCPDGFMFETDYIRYKSINDIVVANGFFKQTFINVIGSKEIPVPKAIGKWALPKWEEYRANRKAARSRKGRRNARNQEN